MAATLRVEELTPRHWPQVEALFGDKGACGGCWCMWWRVERGGALWEQTRGAPAKRAFKKLVTAGRAPRAPAPPGAHPPALAAPPVGGCASGPRADFPRVSTVRAYKQTETPAGLWSINCFYIDKDH